MNVYDSDRMLELVNKEYFLVSSPDNADAILINTCHIREKAAEKVYSEIGKYAYLKDSNKQSGKTLDNKKTKIKVPCTNKQRQSN